jgi:hypothetical protein
MGQMASDRAGRIGVPTVFVNLVGPRGAEKWAGMLGKLMNPEQFRLGGLSTIAGSDGKILGQLDEVNELVLIADVELNPAKKISSRPACHGTYGGGFVTPHPFLFEAICYVDSFIWGSIYRLSGERRRKAKAISSNGRA